MLKKNRSAPNTAVIPVLYYPDVRAKAAGARVLAEPADHMYGERQCSFVDPWGRPWTLSETIFDSDPSDWGGELLVE